MTRLSIVLLIFLLSFICQEPPSSEARKLLNIQEKEVLSVKNNFVSSIEHREPTPAVSLSSQGHEMVEKERLFTLHLANIDRILQSVPSPGAGH
ncbi:Uncharacterized protein TCM_031988 [Theobroma cacao]|uniref:Uncharacterized protein n=1 Tax=Theobroma cacao TaxID=3641 RepID=A0A061F9L4_THECC|nr:Uncharacterized protein TCM_031988 [Theobroma cacao]